jgi:hypothetical protein
MALTGDEHGLIRRANLHQPGRQVDPKVARRDLWRLSEWERLSRTTRAGDFRSEPDARGRPSP